MTQSLISLVESGTRLWLDSIDPDLVVESRKSGATGATSNPIIVADLIRSGRYNDRIRELAGLGHSVEAVAWALTDEMVTAAQTTFEDVWRATNGDDGYVSFELDPLLEDPDEGPSHQERVRRYVEGALRWNAGHSNRLIKVPATAAGIEALEAMVAEGVNPNVTLIFTDRQYEAARDAVWRGAQRRRSLEMFKSCYSIFVSRIDVYTARHVPQLAETAQGLVGILNAQRIWKRNQAFWNQHTCPLHQEIIFASTGTKNPDDDPCRYVQALAGSDIQTNPPATNQAVATSGKTFARRVDHLPSETIQNEIDSKVDFAHLESVLMSEGIAKFADPQKALLELIGDLCNAPAS